MLSWTRHQVTTFLTLVIVGLWIVTAVTRIWIDWPAANVLDALMPVVCGFYFLSKSAEKNEVAA
jgi:hypothetical protein